MANLTNNTKETQQAHAPRTYSEVVVMSDVDTTHSGTGTSVMTLNVDRDDGVYGAVSLRFNW